MGNTRSDDYIKKQGSPGNLRSQSSIRVATLQKAPWIWPDSKVFYKISDSILEKKKILDLFIEAIARFHQRTSIKFVDVKECEPDKTFDYVLIRLNSAFSSSIGRKGGEQIFEISENATLGQLFHELMHLLGFTHDNSGEDLDEYLFKNPSKSNDLGLVGCPLGQSDVKSILNCLCSRQLKSQDSLVISTEQREDFSEGDIQGIEFVYGSPKCTNEHFGDDIYASQPYFECLTCWSESSAFSVCMNCALKCHDGHSLKRYSTKDTLDFKEKLKCDCGTSNHQIGLCTRNLSGKNFVSQSVFICKDCFPNFEDGHVICLSCARKCHQGHKLSDIKYYKHACCDCSLSGTKCSAT